MKIYGIGTDIIEISRIREAINRTSSFKRKVYTEKEIEYIEKKKEPYASYAGRFAAKETVSKALGTGVRGFSLNDVEILNDELGKPTVTLYIFQINFNFKYFIFQISLDFAIIHLNFSL